jgi:lipopolysaccharide assembly outer membrane protein LptD (OstA)
LKPIHDSKTCCAVTRLKRDLAPSLRVLCILTGIVTLIPELTAVSQEQFDISADRLSGSKVGGHEIVVLEGNVKIIHSGTVATADTGFYERERERVRLIGDVRVEQRDVEVRGEEADYLRTARRVIFPRGILADDGKASLRADRGDYDLESEILEVEGHVTYWEGGKRMVADRATYNRETGYIKATGEVLMEDAEYGGTVRAGRVEYERERNYGIAVDNPWLETTARDGREGMMVTADSMEIYTEERRAVVVGDVRILRGDAEGSCGRAVFLDDEDKSILTEAPVIIEEGSSLSGETIIILSSEDRISQVLASGKAKSIYEPAGQERTELAGEEIELHFSEGELSRMHISGGASGVFSPIEQDTSATPSRNEVSGETISLRFKDGEAERATVTGGVEGVYRLEEGAGEGGQVVYRSDSLRYHVPSAVMHLSGKASVEYKGMKLHSDVIEYNSRTHNLYAPLNPMLWEGNDKITGSSLTYNLSSKRGAIIAGRTGYEQGLYTGRVIMKTGERALNVKHGTYTSCDYLDPHYTFTSSKMKMYANDKVITKPVILRVRGIPIFALPFFMFPIKRGRHSGILIPRVEFGFDETKGRFLRNAGYYWAPNDYFDLTAWGDYYENSKWIGHLESRYRARYLLSGSFEGSYQSEIKTGDSRWDIGGRHTQEIGERGRLVVHADFVSDKQYRQETSEDLEKALRRQLESDISYSTKLDGSSFTIAAERRENLDTDVISQTLPRMSFLLGRKTLFKPSEDEEGWHRGTYISASSSATGTLDKRGEKQTTRQQGRINFNTSSDLRLRGKSQSIRSNLVLTAMRKDISEWCTGCVGGKRINSAFDDRTDFIAKFKPLGWINLDPSLSASFTVYDEDKAGKRLPVRFMYSGRISSTGSIYRTFFPKVGPLLALRHVVTPKVSYSHRPDFSKYKGRFYTLPGISSEVGESRTMNIGLSNRLQAKVRKGDEVTKMNNLLSLDTSTSYDFLYEDKGKKMGFSTIRNNLRFYPSQLVTFDLSFSNDPEDFSFENLDFTTRLAYTGAEPLPPGFIKPDLVEPERVPEEGVGRSTTPSPVSNPWHIGAIYRYTKAFDGGDDSYWLDLETGFSVTSNWRIEYSGRFDLSGHETVYQEYSIYRDLHCWEAQFVRRYSAGQWQYYFRINIKAHPEIYTERGLRALSRSY